MDGASGPRFGAERPLAVLIDTADWGLAGILAGAHGRRLGCMSVHLDRAKIVGS